MYNEQKKGGFDMADIFDVAEYALDKLGNASTMKLQKIIFYGQAYSLVKFDEPLFADEIQAWANGPVVPALFKAHRHAFVVSRGFFKEYAKGALSDRETKTLDHVIRCLGKQSGAALSELTHGEAPWLEARADLSEGARSEKVISQKSIKEYYSSPACTNPVFV